MKLRILAAVAALAIPSLSSAAPITFFGENLSPSAAVSGAPLTQRNAFVNSLAPGVGIEDFESPTTLPNIDFPVSSGTVNATLTGGSTTIQSSPTVGAFATSGSNYVLTGGGGDFNILFDNAISAFGFYATDIGDFGSALSLVLTSSTGVVSTLDVGNTVNANSGSLLFFGFLDLTETYTNIAFLNEPNGNEQFGFDDMIVADLQQITNPPAVPLPAAGWMLIAGLGAMGALRRKQRKA